MPIVAMTRATRRTASLALWAAAVASCGESPVTVREGTELAAAKPGGGGTSGPTVTLADPSYSKQGDSLAVKITGSGFDNTSRASWERSGVADPKISVLSTQYVSSTELRATIKVAPDAQISFYDVAVTLTSTGKKGIGAERFEVSSAQQIVGGGLARWVNMRGDVTGRDPLYYYRIDSSTTAQTVSSTANSGWPVSEDGQTIVGGDATSSSSRAPVLWTRSGSTWTLQSLMPSGYTGTGNAQSVASDASRAATFIGGAASFPKTRATAAYTAGLVWTRSAGGAWSAPLELPGGGTGGRNGQVHDVTADRWAVGNVPEGAALWVPSGGVWSLSVIGSTGSDVWAINTAKTLVVGSARFGSSTALVAAYWSCDPASAVCTAPIELPGSCSVAYDVDDLGRIVVSGCLVSGIRLTAAIIAPPYALGNFKALPGFGSRTDGPQAESISSDGKWVVGRATIGSSGKIVGAYWRVDTGY
jgi:hypothetical protein